MSNGMEGRNICSASAAATSDGALQPRIFILSDVRLYREGLALSLSRRSDIDVVGAGAPSTMTLAEIDTLALSAVLLDVATAGGLNLSKEIMRVAPAIKVLALAVGHVDHELIAYAEAGIVGYVPREATVDDLVISIRAALRGELVCSPRVAGLLFQHLAALSRARQLPGENNQLTPREREIMELIQQGHSNKEIARSLRIAPATAKNHVHNILEKLQVSRRGEAAARGWEKTLGERARHLAVG
jgi:DNA-binding NarL/FixJ family response regulator